MDDDLELIERARQHEPDVLGELYDRYAPLVYAYVYRRIGDREVAEDLTGEVFARTVSAVRSGHTWHASFRAWLYRVAHNVVVDHYRRQPPAAMLSLEEIRLVAEGSEPSECVQRALDRERLRRALACLTHAQQEVLALRYGEGLSERETASILEKTVGAVEALQHRALAALRHILRRPEWEEAGGTSSVAPYVPTTAPADKAGSKVQGCLGGDG